MGLRFRLYSNERLRRERLLGESFISLASLDLSVQREQQLTITLDSKVGIKVSVKSQQINLYNRPLIIHSHANKTSPQLYIIQ